jgi:hypothetical protein
MVGSRAGVAWWCGQSPAARYSPALRGNSLALPAFVVFFLANRRRAPFSLASVPPFLPASLGADPHCCEGASSQYRYGSFRYQLMKNEIKNQGEILLFATVFFETLRFALVYLVPFFLPQITSALDYLPLDRISLRGMTKLSRPCLFGLLAFVPI